MLKHELGSVNEHAFGSPEFWAREMINDLNRIADEDLLFASPEKESEIKRLIKKLVKFKRPQQDQLFHHIQDPKQLPSRSEFFEAFPLIPGLGDYNLEIVKAWVDRAMNKELYVYELFTREYVEAFASWIQEEAKRLHVDTGSPIRVLEIGAGDGVFTRFLRDQLKDADIPFDLRATDDASWPEKVGNVLPEDVEQIDFEEALKRYQPQIVLSSWMPPGVDFSKAIRATDSVQTYVLIGPPFDTGSTETWGVSPELVRETKEMYQQSYGSEINSRQLGMITVPSDIDSIGVIDDFEVTENKDLSALQISRSMEINGHQSSKTVVFHRKASSN